MNREIKFRAWDKERRKILTSEFPDEEEFYISSNGEIKYLIEKGLYDTHISKEFREDWVLMQFTGLKDKKEKDIYEGDILKFNNKLFKIEFSHGSYFGRQINANLYGPYIDGEVFCLSSIIGNIYETPVLLK